MGKCSESDYEGPIALKRTEEQPKRVIFDENERSPKLEVYDAIRGRKMQENGLESFETDGGMFLWLQNSQAMRENGQLRSKNSQDRKKSKNRRR